MLCISDIMLDLQYLCKLRHSVLLACDMCPPGWEWGEILQTNYWINPYANVDV